MQRAIQKKMLHCLCLSTATFVRCYLAQLVLNRCSEYSLFVAEVSNCSFFAWLVEESFELHFGVVVEEVSSCV